MNALPVGKYPNHLLKSLLNSIETDQDVIVGPGIGRDAAAVRLGDQILVLKTDPITFAADDIGWYLVNVNANDIACMGADPRWLLVTALLPENETTPDLVESIFADLNRGCQAVGCSLVGGHTEITEGLERPILVGQMIGVGSEASLINPRTAIPGDAVLLVGGIAVEGTSILATDAVDQLQDSIPAETLGRAARFRFDPGISVVGYARTIRESLGPSVRAMHDPTEGGLATGLDEIAQATGLGLEISSDPVHIFPETRAICAQLGLDPWGLIASGALLVVVPEERVSNVIQAYAAVETPVVRIGTLTNDPDQRSLVDGGVHGRLPAFDVDEIARYFAG